MLTRIERVSASVGSDPVGLCAPRVRTHDRVPVQSYIPRGVPLVESIKVTLHS